MSNSARHARDDPGELGGRRGAGNRMLCSQNNADSDLSGPGRCRWWKDHQLSCAFPMFPVKGPVLNC